jgi:hypothetical protein
MTQMTGIPKSFPCQAKANAWLPAEAVMTPLFLSSGDNNIKALRPPLEKTIQIRLCMALKDFYDTYLSLNEPVN